MVADLQLDKKIEAVADRFEVLAMVENNNLVAALSAAGEAMRGMNKCCEDLGMLRIVQDAVEKKQAEAMVELVDLIEADLLNNC
jgi:hypothetical protein